MTNLKIELNPDIDVEALARDYAAKKRIHIPKIFTDETADQIYAVLDKQVPWELTWFDGEVDRYTTFKEMSAMPPQERAAFVQKNHQQANSGFAFAYNTFKFHERFAEGKFPDHPLHAMDKFLTSPEMVAFFQTLTGDQEINAGGGHATWYAPGHFLTIHTDKIPQKDRRAAFVFNFTKAWRPDWGGELKFYAPQADRIEEAFVPDFNSLNVFTVPVPHAVGYVAPFAMYPRVAITGWYSREPS